MDNECIVKNMKGYGNSPIPQEGEWTHAKEINQISGLSRYLCSTARCLQTYIKC